MYDLFSYKVVASGSNIVDISFKNFHIVLA
jgi:hypothetical protein